MDSFIPSPDGSRGRDNGEGKGGADGEEEDVLGESEKWGRGNMKMRMCVGNHFECRGDRIREIGGWMRENSVLLGHV